MECKHPFLVQVDNIMTEYSHPVQCEECRAVVECPHLEIDYGNDFNEPTCVDCLAHGTDVVEPMEYDKYTD